MQRENEKKKFDQKLQLWESLYAGLDYRRGSWMAGAVQGKFFYASFYCY